MTGNAQVTNPEANNTIWTGGTNVNLGGSGNTYIPDPSNPANTIVSSSGTSTGPDIVSGDTNLSNMSSNDFFRNFMGTDPTTFKAGDDVAIISPSNITSTYNPLDSDGNADGMLDNSGIDMATYRTLWINGTTSFSSYTTVGCATSLTGSTLCSDANSHPVIMVIDGDLTGAGTVNVTGILYVRGNIDKSGGNVTVRGALIVEGTVQGSGSVNVQYSSNVISKTKGTTGARASLSGSWRDF